MGKSGRDTPQCICAEMTKAVFLDRDGVINKPVFNPKTSEYEAPHREADLILFPDAIESLKELQNMEFKLFLVSNQPDYAKGKTSLENLHSVHKKMQDIFVKNNINFCEYYYCYHHPKGIVAEYALVCECRKPKNLFLRQAKLRYDLEMPNSWMVGDRDVDIECGKSSGTRTIMIKPKLPDNKTGRSRPDFKVDSLSKAVEIIRNSKLE